MKTRGPANACTGDDTPAGWRAPLARIAQAWAAWRGERLSAAPLVEELEARLLYAADPAGAGLALAGTVIEQRLIDDSGEFHQAAPVEQRRHELLIIGAGIAESQTLRDGLDRDGRTFDVLELDPALDSVAQISAALAERRDLSAIHILSHGAGGQLQLGADTLDAAMLAARAGDIGRWGDALQPGGDILLYGCDVAAGDTGAAFVRQFAALSGADVAASDNLTGDRRLQGDWTLERHTGQIDSATAFTDAAQAQWHGTLEIRANAVTQDKEHEAAVAISPSGAFVVTWTADHDQDGSNTGIFAQRFDASGNPLGAQFQVNTASQDRQETSVVGIAADGSFVVAWASHHQQAGDTDGWGIKAQRFTADGSKVGTEFLVNQSTNKDQWQPSIAVAADGQFVIAWASTADNAIYVRHYDAAGTPARGEVLVSSINAAGNQALPSVGIAADSSYVVAWQSDAGGTAKSIYAQRFHADDTLRGSGFRVNTYDAGDQTQPSVAVGGTGAFVIAWTSAKQDGDAGGVYAQLYQHDGVRLGGEFRVNTVTVKDQTHATAAMDGASNFTIAWSSAGQDNGPSLGVYAQRYDASGAALGSAFLVNSTMAANQTAPAAAMNGDGALVIGWEGSGIGDTNGVFVALYNPTNTPPVANPDAVDVPQGSQVSATAPGVLANDTDADSGATLSVVALLSPADGSVLSVTDGGITVEGTYGSLTLRSDGSYLYSASSNAARALAAGQSGNDVFTYLIRDNNNANASSTLRFTILGLNDAPVAGDDAYAVDRYDRLSVPAAGVLANDTDMDRNPADSLQVVAVNGAPAMVGAFVPGAYGMLRISADGSLSYEPDNLHPALLVLPAGASVTDTFQYEVSDGRTVTNATIRITILGSNSAPVATDDSRPDYTLEQDGSLAVNAARGVLLNDNDPDGNTLSAQLANGPLHGTLTLHADGAFIYTPHAGYSGSDSFTYRASDGSLDSAAATVTLTIVHVNHAPVASDDSAAVMASGSVDVPAPQGLLGNDNDSDSTDRISVISIQYGDQVIAVTPGVKGSLATDYGTLTVDSDGAFQYVADGAASQRLGAGAVTADNFSYTISDGKGGASTAWLSIDIIGVNDAPDIGVHAGAGQTVSDEGSVQPFTGVTITDIDSPTQQLLVQVALDDPAKGRLVATQGGSYDMASGLYTFTGTAAAATAAVGALIFVPTPNLLAPGAVDTTRFTITASDGAAATPDASITIASLSVNDAPVITGTVAAQRVDDAGNLYPFATVTIADADQPAQQLTVRIALDVPAHGTLSGTLGSYDATAGVYTMAGTAAQVTANLRALVFTPAPNRVAPGLTEITALQLTLTDGLSTTSDAATTVIATSVNDAPAISGTLSGQIVHDNAVLLPFSSVTISDADYPAQQLTVRVTLDTPGSGTLSGTAGNYDATAGVYTFVGTAADATTALRSLIFTPTANRVAPGTVESTQLTIRAGDGQASSLDAGTTVLAASRNDAPTISGAVAQQRVDDTGRVQPFATVTIADADRPVQLLTVQVTLDDPARGMLSGGAGRYDPATGIYTFAGSAADASADLRTLIFTPTPDRVSPGLADTSRFTIGVSDGNSITTDASTTVLSVSINDVPAISAVTSAQTVGDNASLHPFSSVNVRDPDSLAQPLTVRVAVDDPMHGSLSGSSGSYDLASGVYRFIGTAAEASAALRALVFTPAANRFAPGFSDTALLRLTIDDGQAQDSAVIHIAVLSVNDAPVLDLPATVQAVRDKESLAPLAGMIVADADSPAQQLTLRVTLDDPAKGRLSAAVGSYDAAAGTYVLTGTAAQLNAAAQALLLTPAENRLAPGQADTVTFSIRVSDSARDARGTMSIAVLSVNDAPVAAAASVRGAQDAASVAIVLAASDVDADVITLVILSVPAHGTLFLDAAGRLPLLPGAPLLISGQTAQIYFRPEAGWAGETGFMYAAVDGNGLAGAGAAVGITVTPTLRTAAQTTAGPATEVPSTPAAAAAARGEEPAPAAVAPASATLLAGSVSSAPTRLSEPVASTPDIAPAAQRNQPPAPVVMPARSSADRVAQAAAALLAVPAATDADSDAMLAADFGAAQALSDARIERVSAAARNETLTRSLDELRSNVEAAEEAEHRIVGSSVAVGASFSVGYVIWLLRGGVLATSLLSSLPAWRFVDPLPVLARMRQDTDDDDGSDESLESLVAGADVDDGLDASPRQPSGSES